MAETASQYRLTVFDTIRGETDRQTRDDGYDCTMQYATATWHVRAKYVSLDAEREDGRRVSVKYTFHGHANSRIDDLWTSGTIRRQSA